MRERDFQEQIVELARLSGFLVYHTYEPRRSAAGFPDLVLVRPPRIIFAELKREAGNVRPEQRVWLETLRACESSEAALWRPRDWPEIERVLAKRSP